MFYAMEGETTASLSAPLNTEKYRNKFCTYITFLNFLKYLWAKISTKNTRNTKKRII